LKSAMISGTSTTDAFDGVWKRDSTTAGANTTRFTYHVVDGLPILLDDGTRKYVWGASGLAHTVEGTGNGTITVYHTDGLGSVRALTDSTGAVVQTYQTDEFGIPDPAG